MLYFLRRFSLRMQLKGKSSSAGSFFLNCSHTTGTFIPFPTTQPGKRKGRPREKPVPAEHSLHLEYAGVGMGWGAGGLS